MAQAYVCLLILIGCSLATVLPGCSRAPACATASETADSLPVEGQVTHSNDGLQAVSSLYTIDRIYRSMEGPWSSRELRLLDADSPELVWITGCDVEVVGADGTTHMPEQFMCHANIDFDADYHNDLFRSQTPLDGRLFTLSQGQLHVNFPPGCGIPVMSNEILDLSTQVLNLNARDRAFDVRHKVDLKFVRDSAAKQPMKPLYERALMGMVSLEGHGAIPDHEETAGEHADAQHGETHTKSPASKENRAAHGHSSHGLPAQGPCLSCCIPGVNATSGYEFSDSLGQRFSTHWIVKPGREENHTRVTKMMALPFDTTLHYIAVHLHPFAESLELRDVTVDRSIFKSRARNLTDEIGLADVEYFSSEAGVPVFKDHEYELVSVYNNTTDQNQDSMAVMYAYFLDRNYRGPDLTLEHLRRDDAGDDADQQLFAPASDPAAAGPICNGDKK